jgi:hypothetical protein
VGPRLALPPPPLTACDSPRGGYVRTGERSARP